MADKHGADERDALIIEALARALFDAEEDYYKYDPLMEPRSDRDFKVSISHYNALARGALAHLREQKLLSGDIGSSL